MSDIAIRVDNLGKRYRLGQIEPYRMLRDSIMDAGRRLFHRVTRPTSQQDSPQDFWAIKDVSFEVKRGEVVGIIGRNGAGKSTLLKILSRITEPTTGIAELNGRVGSLLEVGTGFHPELTGRENIYLNGAILGMTRAEVKSKFDEIVAFAEIEKFLNTPVKRYSSGMYVRLAFAVAAHLEPEILIVDEVLAVGDAEFQRKCLGKMKDVAAGGRTVLFVSHNMAAVEALTTRCILLNQGTIVGSGDPGDVVSRYLCLNRSRSNGAIDEWRSRGDGPQRIRALSALGADGKPSGILRPDEPLRIRILVSSPTPEPFDVAFAVEDHRQQPLFASHFSDRHQLEPLVGEVMFDAQLQYSLLRQGSYLVSCGLYAKGTRLCRDEVLHIPLVEIAGHSERFPVDQRWGPIYMPVDWALPRHV